VAKEVVTPRAGFGTEASSMKRPLLPVAVCYAAGLFVGGKIQPGLLILFVAAFTLLLVTLVWARARPFSLWPLIFLTGWINLSIHNEVLSPYDLRVIANREAEIVSVRGVLLETPSLRIRHRDDQDTFRTIGLMQVSALKRGENWQEATGRISVTTPGILPTNYFLGQRVEISGVLAPPPRPTAPGLFDYRAYLELLGVHFQLKTDGDKDWQVGSHAVTALPLTEKFLGWAQRTLARGLPEQDESYKLMCAMTLGSKTALTGEVNEPFMRSGTMHIFAISGLHIALIAGILVALFRVMQIPRAWCGFMVIPLIWFYTAATGWQASAIRSTVMMTIIIGSWMLRRPTDLLNSLALAALIILICDPQQYAQASFQLSFFVVLSIALFEPRLNQFREHLFKPDPMLPVQLIPKRRRWLRTALMYLTRGVTTSLAAWLGSLPLTAYYFHLLSPVTLLANLLMVPLSSLTLAANLGSLICGDWLPWATELFNNAGWFCMVWMVKTSQWFTDLPAAFRYVQSWSFPTIIIYYFLLVGALHGWLFARKYWRCTTAGLALIATFYLWQWQRSRSEIQLTILPFNGSHGAYLEASGTRNDWLIGCGNTNTVEFLTKPYLRSQGVNRIPRLLVTHGDIHHVGGFEPLEAAFDIGEVYTSSAHFRSPAYGRLISRLEENPARHHTINRGDHAGAWTVLHPERDDSFSRGDDKSLVLLGEFHGKRVLLLSELGRPGQEALLSRTPDLRADIVVAGIPEQGEPLCEALREAIQPKLIIIADSEFPATKRANTKLRERLENRGIPVVYTSKSNAVVLTFRPGKWEFTVMGE
jgi:ComEC/Rec2-related protein